MDSRSFTDLLDIVNKEGKLERYQPKPLKQIVEENKERLPAILPPALHTPDTDELETIKQWAIWFKKDNPSFSKRQIRKATQEHFGVVIFRQPYKKQK